jgi:DNA-binding transcriptional LysR family regulator
MEMRHLRYFVAAAEHLNFSQAARSLGIAQPPLSIQIRNLEDELGTALFIRGGRRISLTAAGQAFLEDAKDILSQADLALHRIQDEAQGRTGVICLGYTDAAFSSLITKRLRKFLRKHPGVKLLSERVTEEQLNSPYGPDAAIVESATQGIPLEAGSLCLAVPPKHRLAERAEAEWADVIGETVLFHPKRTAAEHLAEQSLSGADLQVSRREVADGSIFWHASLGLGIGICSNNARGTLDTVLVPIAGHELQTRLVINPHSRSIALQALVEFLQA